MLKTLAAAASISLLMLAPAAAVEPTYDWTGAYLGLSLGGIAVGGDATTELPEVPVAEYPLDGELTPQLGVSAGYNWMLNDFLLLGVEADSSFTLPTNTAN
ncbi:hypothetical protein [Devosia sp. CN2-171]|uniref:hypothetical protein n=1 Tax=Devosia sp. CN2-171 TaxID=3400909 RepID=UPI003BF79526